MRQIWRINPSNTCENLVVVVAHGQGANGHNLGYGTEPEDLRHTEDAGAHAMLWLDPNVVNVPQSATVRALQ